MSTDIAKLTVSEIRQKIFEASDVPSRGFGALPGQLFHRVASCALTKEHPASWQAVLADDLNADEWTHKLYTDVLGPDLTKSQSNLRENGFEVWQLWCAVQSFTRWVCGVLSEARHGGIIRYDSGRETWDGADALFEPECDLAATLREPDWTAPVTVVGRADHLVRVGPDRWCVIESKLGGGHAEADAAQACLYHELLGGGAGSAALLRFDGNTKPQETLLSAESIAKARPQLMGLIASLAKVHKGDPPEPPTPPSTWPKPAGDRERQQGRQILEVLNAFAADGKLAGDPLVGPTFVRYLLDPGRRIPAKRILGQGQNLQIGLQLEVPPMIHIAQGRIAIDVQRHCREFVTFWELRNALTRGDGVTGNSRVLVGIDLKGQVEFVDLAKDTPHLLVAGVPGSGKSEWLRVAAASLMVTNTPDTLRLILIDPKKNAFGQLRGSSYLWRKDCLVDTPEEQVISILNDLILEMKNRNDMLAKLSADNLFEYQRRSGRKLPRLVCIVDEFADLLMGERNRSDREEIEKGFVRIAQMGRAAGIHLILATQRPSRQIVTGVLKANIPGRVALRTGDRVNSSVILGQSGAECLLGMGDLILATGGGSLVRLQSAYLNEADRAEIFG